MADQSLLTAAVLGLLEGLTEFIPVSSTAHVLIVSQFFGWGDPGAASNLNGGAGQDNILAASTGNDTLAGGTGPDAFYFLASDRGVDTITDFNPTEDILNFMDFNITQDTIYHISEQVGADTVIHLNLVLDIDLTVVLKNTDHQSLFLG